jgi:hypothetical protein
MQRPGPDTWRKYLQRVVFIHSTETLVYFYQAALGMFVSRVWKFYPTLILTRLDVEMQRPGPICLGLSSVGRLVAVHSGESQEASTATVLPTKLSPR